MYSIKILDNSGKVIDVIAETADYDRALMSLEDAAASEAAECYEDGCIVALFEEGLSKPLERRTIDGASEYSVVVNIPGLSRHVAHECRTLTEAYEYQDYEVDMIIQSIGKGYVTSPCFVDIIACGGELVERNEVGTTNDGHYITARPSFIRTGRPKLSLVDAIKKASND